MQGPPSVPEQAPAGAVFLSYASEDGEVAARICAALRAAGLEVWFDQAELRGGDAWDQRIREQIHACRLFVALISARTEARDEGYFRREWKLAVDRTEDLAEDVPFLLPVAIDATSEASARTPARFRAVHWARLPDGEPSAEFVERVARLLSRARKAPVDAAPSLAPATASASPLRASSRARLAGALVAIAVAAVGTAALYAWRAAPRAAGGAEAPAAAEPRAPDNSIAVLPFVDLSEKHDQDYFADGMAEEILNLLVTVPDLRVIGRTSSFQFKGKADDLRRVGSALGAAYVVEGSVRRAGSHIRVTAQLIDARDGTHRWSQDYDRGAADAIAIQDDIAAALVRALQLQVTARVGSAGAGRMPDAAAYDSYLRGLHAAARLDRPGLEEAVASFRRALELEPSLARAAEALASTLRLEADVGFTAPQLGFEQARVAALHALELDPRSAMAHAVLAHVHAAYDWDWPAAEREIGAAESLSPGDANVAMIAAVQRLATGAWDDALRHYGTAAVADPLNPEVHLIGGWIYVRLGRLADAERATRRALQIAPTFSWGRYHLGVVLLLEGRPDVALQELERVDDPVARAAGLALAFHALHRPADAHAALTRLEQESSAPWALGVAHGYAMAGQRDAAFEWIERSYAHKESDVFLIRRDPLLRNLERDPRYAALLRRMNLPD